LLLISVKIAAKFEYRELLSGINKVN